MLSVWDRMLDDMQLAGLAERTQYAYLSSARRLADHVHKPPDQISEDDLHHYFLYLRNERKLSRSSLTIASVASSFFLNARCDVTGPLWPSFARRPSTSCLPSSARPKCMTCSTVSTSHATASV